MEKGLTVVANLLTDDGLTAFLLNAGASAQPPNTPLHVLAKLQITHSLGVKLAYRHEIKLILT
jgi:hypothetical protein